MRSFLIKLYSPTYMVALFLITLLSSCKKFIEIDPPNDRVTEANVFGNDNTAAAVLTGIYSNIASMGVLTTLNTNINLLTISKLGSLSADELSLWSGATDIEKAYYRNALQTNYTGSSVISAGEEMWNRCYGYIYDCNQAIEGVAGSTLLTPAVQQQLLGEGKFLRAFLYFYLINLYGDVPLVTGTNVEYNKQLPRSSKAELYAFLISDLKEAQNMLSASFLNSGLKPYTLNPERVRPTRWAATALLARAYLYSDNYDAAQSEATAVIDQASLFDVAGVPLTSVFLKNSKEAIWQLQPVVAGWNTMYFRWFALGAAPVGFTTTKSVSVSSSLYNSFEEGDSRKTSWVGTYTTTSPAATFYYPYKYKGGQNTAITATNPGPITEYHMVLRLAEQYLIRAEARAKLNNISGAVADLNVLRTRARATPTVSVPNPLPNLPATLTQTETLTAVMQERKVELFTEWAHRWLDIKRTGNVNSIMSIATPLKGGTWEITDQLYPLPANDLLFNKNLAQNEGYE